MSGINIPMFEVFTKLADVITYDFLKMEAATPLFDAVHFFVKDTTKILFLLTVLVFIAGFVRSWVSPEKVRAWLENKPKIVAYTMAVLLGAVTPFCSCSSIPLFIAFLSSGIPLGITMAFLIASPMVNEVAAVLFAETIGMSFMFAYIGAGMATGIIGGALVDAFKLEKWVEPFAFKGEVATCESNSCTPCCASKPEITLKSRATMAWAETASILKSVWLYLIIGVGLGAGIHGFVPQEWFITYAGADNLFAVPLAVIAAIPLYASVTGTIPVAEVLVAKGLPIGTTLAFIMSTVAISLPEIVILRRVLRPQMLTAFILYLAIAFIMLGYGFNVLFKV